MSARPGGGEEGGHVSPMKRVGGIVLAGRYAWNDSPFERLRPRPLLPVAQVPLISHVLRWLRRAGVPETTICTNPAAREVQQQLQDGRQLSMRLDYYEDPTPRGPAGCSRDAAFRSGASTFVVSDASAVPTLDLESLLARHFDTGAAMTIVVHEDRARVPGEGPLTPGGIYVVERDVFDEVSEHGFQDIKENLVPRLHRQRIPVTTYVAPGSCPRVMNARTYLAVNHWAIARVADDPNPIEAWAAYCETGETLAHPTAVVHDTARLLGPVLLGPGARVLAGATVVGPTSVGADCTVGEGAVVSRSVLWERCVLGPRSVVDGSLLVEAAVLEAGVHLFGALRSGAAAGERPIALPPASARPVPALPPPRAVTA